MSIWAGQTALAVIFVFWREIGQGWGLVLGGLGNECDSGILFIIHTYLIKILYCVIKKEAKLELNSLQKSDIIDIAPSHQSTSVSSCGKCFITKDILLILGQLVRDFQKKQVIYNHSHNIISTICHMKHKRRQHRKNYLFLFTKNSWLDYVMIQ